MWCACRHARNRCETWPSRVHLVGMAEAINGDDAELLQFKRQIPKVARMMLPRWRRKLYLPRTECLR